MYNGIEIDMLSLGDADCILITIRTIGLSRHSLVWRYLVDGGKRTDAKAILDFLASRQATTLDGVLCSHLHNDHMASRSAERLRAPGNPYHYDSRDVLARSPRLR